MITQFLVHENELKAEPKSENQNSEQRRTEVRKEVSFAQQIRPRLPMIPLGVARTTEKEERRFWQYS
ncbi:hypothetical protein G5I_01695 [Acromyrmex echinatior]|uniref:Uncharacterized protein n=1 Tax=Acromyrmex echinatior TaxID=103372 RepID=F4W8B4_ACREC|nr:hypothetical protein G5I_01695 [Acromyrmex echinatior]